MSSLWLNTTSPSSDLTSTVSTNTTSTTNTQSTASQTTATTDQNDSVKLSEAGQAKLLYKQGQSVSNIAATLGSTTKAINEELGITLEKELEQTLQATLSAKS